MTSKCCLCELVTTAMRSAHAARSRGFPQRLAAPASDFATFWNTANRVRVSNLRPALSASLSQGKIKRASALPHGQVEEFFATQLNADSSLRLFECSRRRGPSVSTSTPSLSHRIASTIRLPDAHSIPSHRLARLGGRNQWRCGPAADSE